MRDTNSGFSEHMQNQQLAWRDDTTNTISPGLGWQNGKQRPWILPSEDWEQNLWAGIRSGTAADLPAYLATNRIQAHQGKHNLKSSWVHCANLYYPFGQSPDGKELLASFLRTHVSPDIRSVDELYLEFAEPEGSPLHPSHLLGESGGSRGSGQTSPDLAFHVNGRKGLILIENKLTEHSFYRCSGRNKSGSDERPANPNPERCKDIKKLLDDPQHQCHQTIWGRKYWDILRPVMNDQAMNALNYCPASNAGYQLFRQQALAEGIANSGKYDFVYSCVALDERNETLKNCLKSTGIADLESGWSALFDGKARFKTFTHQQWVSWVRTHGDQSIWQSWLNYVCDRYGY